ncbi:secretory lipase 3 [Spathaspora passalidarum NRRL Y-27907]|uniref:Secretory lipase 3 n=1 Tax=Spathaspora passalidarum (strain NRRL Y-27907 / 11-Y1) TaxID=619300 RepID=G3AJK9_SPAPN|nr:secretory lipase 3 [Spathaspora passalidarum NRRL Y-27907]EGW34614.1 secretory lipase 3 [Spathaspora passalidarum NRRL Y-27907]
MNILWFIVIVWRYLLQADITIANPHYDDFYTLPEGFDDAKPGDILKYREVPPKLASLFFPVEVKKVWQLVICSQDTFGNPTAFLSTIIEPYNADPSKVVSYQTFEDSANLTCSPSFGIRYGAPPDTFTTQMEMTFIVLALKHGYFVNSPDYEGFNSAFMVGRRSGQATLDSIRATLRSENITGIKPDAKVALWGYSAGAVVTAWASVLQPSYAPDLKPHLVGAAIGGFAPDFISMAKTLDGTFLSGLIPAALYGIANEYPVVHDIIDQHANPKLMSELRLGNTLCATPAALYYMAGNFMKGNEPFFLQGDAFLEHEVIKEILEDNSINRFQTIPEIPMFLYNGQLDQVIPIEDVRGIYSYWCDKGIESLEYAEDMLNGHFSGILFSAPAAWTWLENRFQGKEPVKGCSRTVRYFNLFYPNSSYATKSYMGGLVDLLMQNKIGPDFNNSSPRLTDILKNKLSGYIYNL